MRQSDGEWGGGGEELRAPADRLGELVATPGLSEGGQDEAAYRSRAQGLPGQRASDKP